jgi:uncharacterized protein (TIGR02145 family)
MAENLNYETETGSWVYNHNSRYAETYGRLYTWAAAMITPFRDVEYSFKIQGACPDGWRMPNDEDWLELEMYIGMSEVDAGFFEMRGVDEGNTLKSKTEWASNGNGSDEIGFSVYPAGWRDGDIFTEMYSYTHFWAGIEPYDLQCVDRWFAFDQGGIGRDGVAADRGYSIRCIYGNATPTVATRKVSDITQTSVTVGCYVSSNGGEYVEENGIYYSTSKNPETSGTKVQISQGTGTQTYNLTGLSPSTVYYIKAYAINNTGTSYGNEILFKTYTSTVTDYDGNEYNTVIIGDQEWMAENLKTTHYADGTEISLVENNTDWSNNLATDKAYCYYENSSVDNYGAIYNWAAAMNDELSSSNNPSGVQGVCPDNWHLPSDDEWKEMEITLGMSQTDADRTNYREDGHVGIHLKSTTAWSNNGDGNNSSGFSAIPGGYRNDDGLFYDNTKTTLFWSSTEESERSWIRALSFDQVGVDRSTRKKNDGNYIRCVKD